MNAMVPGQLQQQDSVYALAAAAAALYAGRASGLYRSQDGGLSWHQTATSVWEDQAFSVLALAAYGGDVFVGLPGGVLCSYDDGENWEPVRFPSPPPRVVALAVSPSYSVDGTIAAGTTEDGIFISTDRGHHWTAWNFGLIDHAVYSVAISSNFEVDGTIFAGTGSGLFHSRSGGRGWHELPFPADAASILSLAVSDGLVYVGTEHNGFFVSDDFGTNWRLVDIGEPWAAVHAIQVVAEPAPAIWLLLDDALICSRDGGHSWIQSADSILFSKWALSMLPLPGSRDKMLVGFADGDILPLE